MSYIDSGDTKRVKDFLFDGSWISALAVSVISFVVLALLSSVLFDLVLILIKIALFVYALYMLGKALYLRFPEIKVWFDELFR